MPKKDVTKNNKKENRSFFKDFKAELKRVIWPTPKQLVNNTTAVVIIVLITAAIVFVLDLVFEVVNDYGVNKLKSFVETRNEQSNEADNNQEAQEAIDNALNENSTDNNSENENNIVNE